MAKLKFYDVSRDYIKYLKHYDNKIPDIDYDRFSKFFCGVVLQIDRYNYFAPVTSFNKQQRTNFLIRDKGRPISSIRFSFMFPTFDQVLTLTDFGSKPQSYKDLVNAEIKYCNQNADKIYKKAIEVYKIGVTKTIPSTTPAVISIF